MADTLWIPAFLDGVRTIVDNAAGGEGKCSIRPANDGKPGAAYKGGGWYFGVYFAGARSMGGSDDLTLSLACGVDVTRVIADVPTARLGDWFLQDGELHQKAAEVTELLMEVDLNVARACNAAWDRRAGGQRSGQFYEYFDTANVGAVTLAPASWVMGRDGKGNNSPVYFARLAFSGLKMSKLRSEVRKA